MDADLAATPTKKHYVPGRNGGTLVRGGGGRKPGGMNQTTRTMREHVQRIIDKHGPKFVDWIAHMAEGKKNTIKEQERTQQVWAVPPNPDRAMAHIVALAEYVAPKLARIEHTGADGGPLQIEVVSLALQLPAQAQPSPQDASMVVDLGDGT